VVSYRADVRTFEDIVTGRLSSQEAFFERRVAIEGDVETGLKLAVLFGEFVRQCPYRPTSRREPPDAAA
jgi:predicted lipid carrier protein YhbT